MKRIMIVGWVAAACAFGAQAETITYNETQTVSTPLSVSEATTIDVADKVTVTFDAGAVVSGGSPITKTGKGKLLICSANGGFTGGFVIEQGYLIASNATALGTAAVEVRGQTPDYTGPCGLGLWGAGSGDTTVVTYANAVNVTGNSALAYPALVVYGQNAALTGKITAAQDFVFYDDHDSTAAIWSSYSDRSDHVVSLTFGEIEASGAVRHDGWTKFIFNGPVTATKFDADFSRSVYDASYYNDWATYVFNDDFHVAELVSRTHTFAFNKAGGIDGLCFEIARHSSARCDCSLAGAHRFSGLKSVPFVTFKDDGKTAIGYGRFFASSGSSAAMTVSGNAERTPETCVSSMALGGNTSFTLDAYAGFTQVLSNRVHDLSGTLTVNAGKLLMNGATRFSALKTAVVGADGELEIDTTLANAVKSLTSLTVNGRFTVSAASPDPLPAEATLGLVIGANGFIDFGGRTLCAKSVTLNGETLKYATIDHAHYPDNIAEGTRILVGGDKIGYTETDMTVNGDWYVFVDKGCSNVVTAAQSGTGRIIKSGQGWLVLTKDSTFSGGVQIEAGRVTVDSENMAGASGTVVCTALGKGTVTILGQREGYSGICELDLIGAGKDETAVLTVANPIHVTGDSTGKYPSIVVFEQNATLTGKVTADRNFVFLEDEKTMYAIAGAYSSAYQKVTSLTFGEVEVAEAIHHDGWANFVFNGPVKAKSFNVDRTPATRGGSNWNAAYVFNDTVDFGSVTNARHNLTFNSANVLPKCKFIYTDSAVSYGYTYVGAGMDQSVGAHASAEQDSSFKPWTWNYDSSALKTLTFTGVDPEDPVQTYVSYLRYNNKLSIAVDAYEGFTQVLRNRVNEMSGTIAVRKGALQVDGTATFTGVTAVTVERGGSLIVDTTTANAFSGVKQLTVNGSLTIGENAVTPFKLNGLVLDLGTEATLDVPYDSITVDKLYINGQPAMKGSYTSEQIPSIPEGVTITSNNADTPKATAWATWTNATGDGLMSTMGNWEGSPESLDFVNGRLGVSVASGATANGESMVYSGETHLNTFTNLTYFETGADKTVHPLVLEPASPGDKLVLHRGLYSNLKGQIVFKGHIALPNGAFGTGTEASDPYIIYYYLPHFTAATAPQGAIENSAFSSSTHSIPLVLWGATVDPAIRFYHEGTQASVVHGYRGTTNVVNGYVTIAGYQGAITADTDAVLEFRGGLNGAQTERLVGPGEIRFVGKPVTMLGTFTEAGCRLVLDAEGCKFTGNSSREGLGLSNGPLEFRRSGCFNTGDQQLYFNSASYVQTIEFNATTQRVGIANFVTGKSGSSLRGDYPAMLEVTGKARSGATNSFVKALACSAQVTGGLGFHVCAESDDVTFPLSGQAFESCGDLEVSGGALELAAGASWLNGTNFTARGTGTLKFGGSRQVSKDRAVLRLSDAGKVEIANKKTIAVAECWVGDEKIEDGDYTYATAPAALKSHLANTTGRLRVGSLGLMMIVR